LKNFNDTESGVFMRKPQFLTDSQQVRTNIWCFAQEP